MRSNRIKSGAHTELKIILNIKKTFKQALIIASTFFISTSLIAKPLESDPAWSKQVFENGFTLYSTQATQRPNDPIELRLVISTGSLAETLEEKGALTTLFYSSISKNKIFLDKFIKDYQPLVTIGYDEIIISMTVKENSSTDLVKSALGYMAELVNFDENNIVPFAALKLDPIHKMATKPANPQDTFWLNRIHDSNLVGSGPSLDIQLLDKEKLAKFHETWFTPDAMKLFVAGKIDNRVLTEELNRTFAKLKGVRQKNQPLAVLQPLKGGAILAPATFNISTGEMPPELPIVSLYWDSQWQSIKTSKALEKWWEMELAREAIFTRINKALGVDKNDKLKLNIECNVAYQRQLCGIRLSYTEAELQGKFQELLNQLATLEDKGISDEEFKQLIMIKNDALANLFATYAKTDLGTLIDNKIHAEQNGIQDISLEDYQQLRQAYLSSVTKETINQSISKFLSQEATILLRENKDSNKLDPAILLQKYKTTFFPNLNNEDTVDTTNTVKDN